MDVTTLLVIVAVLAVGAWLVQESCRRRVERIHLQVATDAGLTYSPRDTNGFTQLPFAFFQREGRHRTAHVMGNPRDPHLAQVFEHTHTAKDNKTRLHATCALINLGGRWPHLQLGPEGPLAGLARLLGVRDIELESEEFNRRFRITCDDRRFASALIDPRLMDWLLTEGTSDLRIELLGEWALCTVDRLKAAAMPGFLAFAHRFREHIPPVVFELYPGPARGRS